MKVKKFEDFEEYQKEIEEIRDIFLDFKDLGFDVKIIRPDEHYYDRFGIYKCSLRIFGWVETKDIFNMSSEISINLKNNIKRIEDLVDNIDIRRYEISNLKLNEHGQILPSSGIDLKISINFDIS